MPLSHRVYRGIICFFFCFFSSFIYAEPEESGLGQTIQIYTQLTSFVGRPSWLLIIRDIDHNQNIPYVFDITKGDNFWLAFTYGRNYFITASHLQFSPYRSQPYTHKSINNFCGLESNGRINRGQSLYIVINGALTPYSDSYTCHVSSYSDSQFTIVNQNPNNP